jgi:hypothetical protein
MRTCEPSNGISSRIFKGKSTVSNLHEYSSFILKSIESGCQVESIYMDFSKAFDKVRHRLLLNNTSSGVD